MAMVTINARGSPVPLAAFASVAGELAPLAAAHREHGDVAPHAILRVFPRG
jgi:hypothetical protein